MIKCLYTSGDSYGFGAELGPAHYSVFDEYRRKHCYSGLISDTLKIEEYQNTSTPGGSNERVYRLLVTDIPKLLTKYKPEEIFCTLTLTSAIRREFCDNYENYMIFLPHQQPAPKSMPEYAHMNNLWEILIKDFNNDKGIYTYNFMINLAIQNLLKQLKIPYLITYSMLSSWEQDIENRNITPDQFSLLYNTPRIYRNDSFMSFVVHKSLPVGPENHPLEEGHKQWANILLNYIKTNDLLNNKDL
jgi:hypothetical protein